MYMQKMPHKVILKVFTGAAADSVLLGQAELSTEDLISLNDFGRELILYLKKCPNYEMDAYLKVRVLFTPTKNTLSRMNS